jgi:hypothetical protein
MEEEGGKETATAASNGMVTLLAQRKPCRMLCCFTNGLTRSGTYGGRTFHHLVRFLSRTTGHDPHVMITREPQVQMYLCTTCGLN